jgi:predicted glycoside hydrolase/deacetylase ChbG (UPF0249 family)
MKQLIVNADDLGADPSRNAGIFEAIAAGVVTSVSILPNGPALRDGLRRIRGLPRDSVSIGIHFNLSEGKPLSSGLRLLTGPDGCFLGKKPAQSLLVRSGCPELENEIRQELNAQIAALRNAGLHPDHSDGHQHVHVLPAVLKPAADAARMNGIAWVRIPAESPAFQADTVSSGIHEEAHFFCRHAEASRPVLDALGFRTTIQFRGLYFKGRLPSSHWFEFLESIPHGLTELMVHPGRFAGHSASGPFSGFSTRDREMELEALTDGRFRMALRETGVELTQFPKTALDERCES